ncbi:serine hydrolase domain-containing protein [Blastococcus sp. SYSU D00813]
MTTPPPIPRPTRAATLDDARATIAALMARHHVPGLSVAVTDADRLLLAEGLGHADLATRRPSTADTGHPWFSMSKIATATAAMRLADEGRLDLDAPVGELVPGFAARSRVQPRVRQLLSHTAGVANPLPIRWVLPGDATDGDADAFARRLLVRYRHPKRPAGGPARYSNLGYLVLAEAISRAAGEPFPEHVRRAVLEPSGMTATGYAHRAGAAYATGHVRLPRPATPLLRAALPAGIVGDRHGRYVALRPFRVAGAGYGGLIGPVTDAARLLRLHLADGTVDGTRVLTPESARAMRTISSPGRPFDVGLGWFRRPEDRDARPGFVEHWGTGGGFWNAMRLYPELGLGVVVMANTTRPYDHAALMAALIRAVAR